MNYEKRKGKKLCEIVDWMYHLNGNDIVYTNDRAELDFRIEMIKRKEKIYSFKNATHWTYRFHIMFKYPIDFEAFEKTVKEDNHYHVGLYKNNTVMNTFHEDDFLNSILSIEGKVISFKDEQRYSAICQINKYLEI